MKYFFKLTEKYPLFLTLEKNFSDAKILLLSCIHAGGKILTCGNGGSATDAEHVVGELMKSFLLPRPLPRQEQDSLQKCYGAEGDFLARHLEQGIPALSLVSGVALPTAFANDVAAELCFAQQVYTLAQPCDVVWGISTSGNSANVNHALRAARMRGAKTLGFTGRDGGKMAELCDVELRVPAHCTPEIQELHLPLYHALCAEIENSLFEKI